MIWKVFIVLVFIIITSQSGRENNYFGSKTSYFANGSTDDSPISVPGCKPVLFWYLARHGTRNPSESDIEKIRSRLPGVRNKIVAAWRDGMGDMAEDDVNNLLNWKLPIKDTDAMLLTSSGKKEHYEQGARWRARLDIMNLTSLQLRSSTKQRAVASGQSFLSGFLAENMNKTEDETTDGPDIEKDNALLRFYDSCTKYKEEVKENKKTYRESKKFIKSNAFKELAERVTNKTGVSLEISDISIVWQLCRFELAWYPSNFSSSWCSLFRYEDLKTFEFLDDLKYFYKDGYAFKITAKMTQPLFADIVQKMKVVQEQINTDYTILNFAHEETVLPFLTALGLYQDQDDLLASDWPAKDHLWKTSKIGSFASNVGILVLQCKLDITNNLLSTQPSIDAKYDWKVMVFHQESLVVQPWCGGLICKMSDFIEKFESFAGTDFNSICQNN